VLLIQRYHCIRVAGSHFEEGEAGMVAVVNDIGKGDGGCAVVVSSDVVGISGCRTEG
jgi:hypothetical protein